MGKAWTHYPTSYRLNINAIIFYKNEFGIKQTMISHWKKKTNREIFALNLMQNHFILNINLLNKTKTGAICILMGKH